MSLPIGIAQGSPAQGKLDYLGSVPLVTPPPIGEARFTQIAEISAPAGALARWPDIAEGTGVDRRWAVGL